jgi:hypothetical protein
MRGEANQGQHQKRKGIKMKTLMPKLFRWKLARVGVLCVAVATVVVVAGSDAGQGRVKLGGMWVGRNGDITWTGTYVPDGSGQQATVTLQWITMSVEFQALLASIGAEGASIASGSISMVSPDTAVGKLTWYLYAPGKISTTQPVAGQIKAIAVMANEWHFTSPTTALGNHNLKLYFPDPQGSMVPNEAYLFLNQDFKNTEHLKIN